MSEAIRVPEETVVTMSHTAREVIAHLCEGECHTFGDVLQWCETRGDCVYAVICPGCASRFLLDEDELCALERWTKEHGGALVCGIRESA